jgi:hypothetical protein
MRRLCATLFTLALTTALVGLSAHAPSGAIFTTLPDGSEVNYNHYPSKDLVYLDGGPGPGAPQTAAGLDDGTYVFQVTDPPGKRLLSMDPARCRQFTVAAGVINGVVDTDCEHTTGFDIDHNAVTVQLMPYKDTPNNGGVYKVWAVRVDDFLAGCAALGKTNGLDLIDCGYNAANAHGFVPSHSKTDNFKAKPSTEIREIDTRFFQDLDGNGYKLRTEPWIDGLQITWIDPLGASNVKSSYLNVDLDINHEAHVEAIENGIHQIVIADQPGCAVGAVFLKGHYIGEGPMVVPVEITTKMKAITIFVDVACKP